MLEELIKQYKQAQAAWREADAIDDRLGSNEEAWAAYELSEKSVLTFPCATLDEARIKASFFLSDDAAFDTLLNCHTAGGTKCLTLFLESLLVTPVDKSNNGEN